jgi:microcystin-dependent protein
MSRFNCRRFAVFFVLSASFLPVAYSTVPSTFTYQGSLKQNGAPMTGNYSMEFRITNSAGALYWSSGVRTINIQDGLYKVDLAPGAAVNWTTADPYMEIKLGTATLLPREKITSSVYALMAKELEGGIPGMTGEIRMWTTATPPDGWFICNGSTASRTTYAALFAVIGTTFGSGDGSTTFNIPDFRGRTPIGSGTGSGLTPRTLAGTVGAETHTHSITHKHRTDTVNSGGALAVAQNPFGTDGSFTGTVATFAASGPASAWPYQLTDDSTNSTSGAGSSMQPSLIINFIIKN